MKRFIGDAVMTCPLLDAIETEYSNIHIICAPVVAQVLHNPRRTRTFLPLDTRRKPWEVFAAAMEVRKHRFDTAVLVNHSFRSAVTIKLAGIKQRVGHATEGRNGLLTASVPYSEDQYEAWSVLDLAPPLDLKVERTHPRLPISEEESIAGLRCLDGATVGIQPGARFASKMLPLEMIAEVCRQLQSAGHKLAFLGSKEEQDSAEQLQRACLERVVNLVGVTDVRTSLGALCNLKLMVGADTGLMHMAVASTCPTVTVFGPTPAKKWGHYYEPHRVLHAPHGDMSQVTADTLFHAAISSLQGR